MSMSMSMLSMLMLSIFVSKVSKMSIFKGLRAVFWQKCQNPGKMTLKFGKIYQKWPKITKKPFLEKSKCA